MQRMRHPTNREQSPDATRDENRARKIAELKKAVASGTYRVKARELAFDIIESLVET